MEPAIAGIALLTFIFVTVSEVMKFKLKKEQIKADALVRTEEIKAKNQLDIEKLIMQERVDTAQSQYRTNTVKSVNYVDTNTNQDEAFNERRDRLNERM